MAAVTIIVILEPPKMESVTDSICSFAICHEMIGPDARILVFECCYTLFFFSPLSIGSLFPPDYLPLEWYHLHMFIFLPAVFIPAHELSSPAFHMIYSAYKLNKQSGNTQPCYTPFPILNKSVLCPVLTFAS